MQSVQKVQKHGSGTACMVRRSNGVERYGVIVACLGPNNGG